MLLHFRWAVFCTKRRTGNDEAPIREIVSKYVDARERNDPKAVEALFTGDADQLVSSGEWRKGRDAVVRGAMASSRSTGGKRTITVEQVRFVTPEVAIADGRYELTGLSGGTNRSMWATLVHEEDRQGVAHCRDSQHAACSSGTEPMRSALELRGLAVIWHQGSSRAAPASSRRLWTALHRKQPA